MKVALVSCTKLKASHSCNAKKMYQKSTLFKKAVTFIQQQDYDDWYILSAKYGLLRKDDWIKPYDLTLNKMKVSERKTWSDLVLKQIEEMQIHITQIDFYTGTKYREYLIPPLERMGIICKIPLQGRGIGEQLQFYKKSIK